MLHTRIIPAKDGFSLLYVSPRLALMYRALKRPGKGGRKDRIQAGYFGFNSEAEAKAFVDWINRKYPGNFIQIREPERLSECAFEVKVREFSALLDVVRQCAAKHSEQAA